MAISKSPDDIVLESGTLPGDQDFRRDIEGLRAIAVILVILAHAAIPGLSGGFIGVDVFYVISGFVITGVLLRRIETQGHFSFADFYARRARRILPAAGLVLLVTIFVSFHYLGFLRGATIANDARWCASFLANFHFSAVGTSYFGGQLPPSPLQNFWSLSVEEQFYVVYPLLVFSSLWVFRRTPARTKIAVVTGVIIVVSLYWSIRSTSENAAAAYFSSYARAWELGLGGLICAATAVWTKIAPRVAATLTWVGLGAIVFSAIHYSPLTAYPGYAAVLPVAGAGLIVLGGMRGSTGGASILLTQKPLRWIGKISYSLYLWSWPLLTIAKQDSSQSLTLIQRCLTIAAAVAAAALTYYLVENPLRRARLLVRRPWISIALGIFIIGVVISFASYKILTIPSF